jgi:hypothetical protein
LRWCLRRLAQVLFKLSFVGQFVLKIAGAGETCCLIWRKTEILQVCCRRLPNGRFFRVIAYL